MIYTLYGLLLGFVVGALVIRRLRPTDNQLVYVLCGVALVYLLIHVAIWIF